MSECLENLKNNYKRDLKCRGVVARQLLRTEGYVTSEVLLPDEYSRVVSLVNDDATTDVCSSIMASADTLSASQNHIVPLSFTMIVHLWRDFLSVWIVPDGKDAILCIENKTAVGIGHLLGNPSIGSVVQLAAVSAHSTATVVVSSLYTWKVKNMKTPIYYY